MHPAIKAMLTQYGFIKTIDDEKNALKEIIQKICLVGLHRNDFFEKASFYGGTALRILYSLERFSEDLDFCLDKKDLDFRWVDYKEAVLQELRTYGFEAEFESKKEDSDSAIGSAFVKQSTLRGLILIESKVKTSRDERIKVRLEIDKSNPSGATYEKPFIYQPEVAQIKTLDRPSLFAGKMHAIIARQYQKNVKGRDYFDLLFYLRDGVRINLPYLENKLKDTGHINPMEVLSEDRLREIFLEKIADVNFKQAVTDVSPYISSRQQEGLRLWSSNFFAALAPKLLGVESSAGGTAK